MSEFEKPERRRIFQITVIVISVLVYGGVAVYFNLVLRTGIVYTHLAYIPIILAGMWWGRRSILVAALLAGHDFPDNLSKYSLVIHCGACMFNRREMLSRIITCHEQGVPVTNYGVAIAHIHGILDRALVPFERSNAEGTHTLGETTIVRHNRLSDQSESPRLQALSYPNLKGR